MLNLPAAFIFVNQCEAPSVVQPTRPSLPEFNLFDCNVVTTPEIRAWYFCLFLESQSSRFESFLDARRDICRALFRCPCTFLTGTRSRSEIEVAFFLRTSSSEAFNTNLPLPFLPKKIHRNIWISLNIPPFFRMIVREESYAHFGDRPQ